MREVHAQAEPPGIIEECHRGIISAAVYDLDPRIHHGKQRRAVRLIPKALPYSADASQDDGLSHSRLEGGRSSPTVSTPFVRIRQAVHDGRGGTVCM